jgi:hypothetical protein
MAYSSKSSKSSAASILAAKQSYGKFFEQNVCAHLSSVGFFGQTGVPCMNPNGKQSTEIDALVQNAQGVGIALIEMKSSLHPENWAKYLAQSERQIRFYPEAPLVVCTRASKWHQQKNLDGYKQYVAVNCSPKLLNVIHFATTIEELLAVVRPEMQALEPMNIVVSSEEPANEIDDLALIFSKLEIDDDVTPMSY